ncbi:MAG: hypothetical protein PQJ44_00260, partial [Sphaerochaetaceae bacterium]|nr:hypothetical protein [Sphaerochaetaceae bacterium]
MAEWRTTTNLIDVSQIVSTSADTIAFTALKAKKGILEPRLLYAGETQKALDYLGYPDSDYPAIQDVLNVVKAYDCYVSAPFDTASAIHGGVFVTKTGSVPFASGLDNAEITDFSDITQEEEIGTGDGTTTTFNFTTQLFDYYTDLSIDILVDDVSQSVVVSSGDTETLSTTGGDSGTFVKASGTLEYTFATAPSTDAVIKVQYTIDMSSDCYFALISKGAQTDDIAVTVEDYNSAGQFTLNMYRQDYDDSTSYNEFTDSPYTVSIISGDKDGYGNNVYIEDVFDEDSAWYISVALNLTTFDTFTDDTDYIDFAGGDRGDDISASDLVEGFDYLSDADTYSDIGIVFDTSAESTVVTEFETLRGTDSSPGSQYRTKFLVPCA